MDLDDFLTAYHLAGNTQRLRAAYRLGGVGVATRTALSILMGIARIKLGGRRAVVFFFLELVAISIIALLIYGLIRRC